MGSVVAAIIAAFAASVVSLLSARREAYKRVLDALDFMASERVANARHEMGAVVNSTGPYTEDTTRSERIAQLFQLTWAAQRIEAVRRTLGPELRPFTRANGRWANALRRTLGAPHQLLRDSVGSWIVYWVDPPTEHEKGTSSASSRLLLVADRLGGIHLDEDDTAGFDGLITAWGDNARLSRSTR